MILLNEVSRVVFISKCDWCDVLSLLGMKSWLEFLLKLRLFFFGFEFTGFECVYFDFVRL